MTKREFLRNELLRGVEAKIVDSGFKLIKSKACFIKKTTFGWMKYVVTFLLDDNGWIIRPDLLARFNNVEDFFHQGSGFEKKNIKKLDEDYYRYYESFSDGFYLETYNNIRELVFKDIE